MPSFRQRRRPTGASCFHQAGLSLVELMVALVLGLMLTAGIIQLFVGSKQTYRFQEAYSRVQENGRYLVEALNRDIRMAGNMGCVGNLQRENPTGTGNLAPGYFRVTLNNSSNYEWDFGSGLQGYQWNGSGWTPALPTALAAALSGSDVITLRGMDGGVVKVTSHPGGNPPGSAALGVSSGNGVDQFDILAVADCTSAAVFQVSTANPDTSGSLAHNTGVGTPGNATRALGRDFVGADVMRVSTRSYFIANGVGGGPALFRRVNLAAAEELVEGIERMRFAYGVDTSGDRVTDVYLSGSQVEAASRWGEVVSVRVSLLLRSIENNVTDGPRQITFDGEVINSGAGADRRLRQVFTTIVSLRNRLP
ncbi:PilW family protein [Sedimenticola hydrogenitrophicus]|uniref:PilW family protein n=1 Tax=Sedimenticola hydrogenitrophicus TaxID=2967975 RepID=UPI0023AEF2E1|nr:PilW family protein [Sedimenticola hydrogenitrophicus]